MSQAKWVLTDDMISFSECSIREVKLCLNQGTVLVEEHKSSTDQEYTESKNQREFSVRGERHFETVIWSSSYKRGFDQFLKKIKWYNCKCKSWVLAVIQEFLSSPTFLCLTILFKHQSQQYVPLLIIWEEQGPNYNLVEQYSALIFHVSLIYIYFNYIPVNTVEVLKQSFVWQSEHVTIKMCRELGCFSCTVNETTLFYHDSF